MNTKKVTPFFNSRANYWLEFIFTISLFIGLLSYTIYYYDFTATELVVSILAGALAWTLLEYVLHSWLLHKSSFRQLRKSHAQHHVDPILYDAPPFYMPSLYVLGILFILQLIFPIHIALLLTCMMNIGFYYYGFVHMAIHHINIDFAYLNNLKAFHEVHHKHPGKNYGVTTSFWDRVFRTC